MTRIIWTGGALICLAGLLLYGFGTNNPNALRWLIFSCAMSLGVLAWAWKGCPLPQDRLIWAVVWFLAYAGLSLSWSLDWREGLNSVNQLAIMATLFIAALHVRRGLLLKSASLFAVVGVLIHAAISKYHQGIFGGLGNENFQSEFLVIIAPLCCITVVVWRNPILQWCGPVASAVALSHAVFFNPSDAKWAALAGIGGFAVLVLAFRGWYVTAFSLIVLGFVSVASAFYSSSSVSTSIMERAELVYDTLMMWRDSPLFGTGIGSFNYAYPFYQEAHLSLMNTSVVKGMHNYAGAAHNEFVQALSVFGVAGFLILCAIGYFGFSDRSRDAGAWFGAASLFAFFGASIVGFPAQNASTAILGVIAAAIICNTKADVACGVSGRRLRHSYA